MSGAPCLARVLLRDGNSPGTRVLYRPQVRGWLGHRRLTGRSLTGGGGAPWGIGLVPGAGEPGPEQPFLKGGRGDLLEALGLATCFYQARKRAREQFYFLK